MRVDIQWLRAVAVLSVLLYHLWPKRLPGGFVGVDIFFVISGFLITSHLLAKPPTTWAGVIDFWGRRVRRLLPAAFLVILATVVGVVAVLPMTQWAANGLSAAASGLYVQNWNLALSSVDYLAQDQAPTALQHYWSLSVEEQFYFIWPMLFLLVGMFALRVSRDRFRAGIAAVIAAVFVLSLGWSVFFTAINPAQAYFVTFTRMWELALGGLVAVAYPALARRLGGRPVAQVALVAVGVVAMLGTAFLLTVEQPFPGWIAVIPTAGAALVIVAGPAEYRFSFDRILRWRPVQFIGDASYSIYLWHWPFVVMVPVALGRPMSWIDKLVVVAVVLALSWVSKTFVEDRFRGSRPLGVPLRRTFIFLLVGMVLTAGSGWGIRGYADLVRVQEAQAREQQRSNAQCLGAAELIDPACAGGSVHGDTLLADPLEAATDRSQAYDDNCWWSRSQPTIFPRCDYGTADPSAPEVALIGNSHAGPWLTPLQAIATRDHLRIRTYLASECFPSIRPISFDDPAVVQACSDFTAGLIEQIKQRGTKLVVWSTRTASRPLQGVPAAQAPRVLVEMHSQMLRQFGAAGIRVLVIRDVPMPPDNVTDCVAQNAHDLARCDGPRSKRILPDPLFEAAQAVKDPMIGSVDFTNAICDAQTCYDVVGGLIVYFNQGHLSASFAATLTEPLREAVLGQLK